MDKEGEKEEILAALKNHRRRAGGRSYDELSAMAAAKEISADADKELKEQLFLSLFNPAAACFHDADKDATFWWLFELLVQKHVAEFGIPGSE